MRPACAVVINLQRRHDRLTAFLGRWRAARTGIPLRVLVATDGREQAPTDPAWAGLDPNVWACWDSHVRALRMADGPALILEDDAVLTPGVAQVIDNLTAPPGWEILYLGGQHMVPPEPLVPGLVTCKRTLRSHAYLVRYPQVLAAGLRTHHTHVDFALARLPFAKFAIDPWVIGQDDSPGDVTRTAPDGVEFWHRQEAARA